MSHHRARYRFYRIDPNTPPPEVGLITHYFQILFLDQNYLLFPPCHTAAPLPPGQYMQQDEEWEREGLLDPAWEKQQRKVSRLGKSVFLYSILLG